MQQWVMGGGRGGGGEGGLKQQKFRRQKQIGGSPLGQGFLGRREGAFGQALGRSDMPWVMVDFGVFNRGFYILLLASGGGKVDPMEYSTNT